MCLSDYFDSRGKRLAGGGIKYIPYNKPSVRSQKAAGVYFYGRIQNGYTLVRLIIYTLFPVFSRDNKIGDMETGDMGTGLSVTAGDCGPVPCVT